MSEHHAQQPPPAKDPMKSFRGIMAGTLIMEAITVALALPIVAKLGAGITSAHGWGVMVLAVLLLLCSGFLGKPWITGVVLALQGVLIAFFFFQPSVGVIGVIFLGVWLYLFWLRRDVARRMAAGLLPSQQDSAQQDSAQQDSAQQDSGQPDSAQPDSAQPDSAQS